MERIELNEYVLGAKYRFIDHDDGEEFIAVVDSRAFSMGGDVAKVRFTIIEVLNSTHVFCKGEKVFLEFKDDYGCYEITLHEEPTEGTTVKLEPKTTELNYKDKALVDLFIDMALATNDKAWFDELCKHKEVSA